MRSTILAHPGRARPVRMLGAAAAAAAAMLATVVCPREATAHEIPNRVTVLAFVRADSATGRLRVLVRTPLEALRDVDFPQRGPGYLDLARSTPLLRGAAQLWIADAIRVHENGTLLPPPGIVAARISLPSDRAFTDYASALATTTGAPLDTTINVPWQQAVVDVLLEYPIQSASSDFAIEPQLAGLGIRTTTVLRFISADDVERAYQYVGDPGAVRLDPHWYHAAWQFVQLGVHHILGGIDHLLFVLCLVVPFRRFRPLLLIITAFTVGHSITLISAAAGIVPSALWFPPLIETLIAASIVYMAIENVVGAKLNRRWIVAFGFGLVHGFGFSFALAESLQFAGRHLVVSLFTFNLGVEIGQILVLAVCIPLLSLLFSRVLAERFGVVVVSALIGHTAWHWMTARGATLAGYRITWPAPDLAFAASALRALLVVVIAGGAAWMLSEMFKRMSAGGNAQPEAGGET